MTSFQRSYFSGTLDQKKNWNFELKSLFDFEKIIALNVLQPFEYQIFEVLKNGKLRDVGIVSHKVNENGSGGSRRRLLQAGGADS